MSAPRPAVKIVFAPLARRGVKRGDLLHLYGTATGRTIKLDPRLHNLGRTLLHELLHVQHPDWTEEKVHFEEDRRWARMTWKQKARMYQLLGSATLEGE
jgi:hypothetical protein